MGSERRTDGVTMRRINILPWNDIALRLTYATDNDMYHNGIRYFEEPSY